MGLDSITEHAKLPQAEECSADVHRTITFCSNYNTLSCLRKEECAYYRKRRAQEAERAHPLDFSSI